MTQDGGHRPEPPRFDPTRWDAAAIRRMENIWRDDFAAGKAPCYCASCAPALINSQVIPGSIVAVDIEHHDGERSPVPYYAVVRSRAERSAVLDYAAGTRGDVAPIRRARLVTDQPELAEALEELRRAGLIPPKPPDVVVTGGATGIRVTAATPPTRIGTMTVSGPGSVGIDLGDDE